RRHDRRRRRPAPDQHDHVPERVRRADRRLPGNPVRTRPGLGSASSPQPSSLFSFLSISRAYPIRSFSTSNINHDTFKSVGSPVPRWRRKPQEDRTMKSIIRKDEAAVSPVIATLLIVAITVVLAAVLYVMISGLLTPTGHGPRVMVVNIGRSGDGTNWTLLITTTPRSLTTPDVSLTLATGRGVTPVTPTS